jgi:hypothetical protein
MLSAQGPVDVDGVIFLPMFAHVGQFQIKFCFGAIPDIMIELIVYGSVPQSRQS